MEKIKNYKTWKEATVNSQSGVKTIEPVMIQTLVF
jgi:hypothetical protein